jgi:hypothetical protein
MAIDRQSRDEMAAALLAFMRGEIGGRTYLDRMCSVCCNEKDLGWVHVALCDLYDRGHAISTSQQGWESLRRVLAFLKSDLPLKRVHWKVWRRHEKTAAAGFAGLVLAACVAALTGAWWIILVVWLGLGAAWPFLEPWPPSEPEIEERLKAWPFRTEAQWKAYKPLLDGMHLPLYDEGLHYKPVTKPGSSLAQMQDPALRYACGCLLGLPIVLLIALWPFHTTFFAALKQDGSS